MEKNNPISTKRERSSAYPSINLETAISSVTELRQELGAGPYGREEAAKALGYSGVSGASSQRIAALVHYGLLLREGNAYRQSELSDRIVVPISDEDKRLAIYDAATNPTLYRRVVAKFSGQAIPGKLSSILFHQFGIKEKVANSAAEALKQSFEFAGILKNGIVIADADTSLQTPMRQDSEISGLRQTANRQLQSFPLPSGIVIQFPSNFASDVAMGEFASEIKKLEERARELRKDIATQTQQPLCSGCSRPLHIDAEEWEAER